MSVKNDCAFIISWEIVNFSLNDCEWGKSIVSPVISVDYLKRTKWFLKICPNGNCISNQCFVSYFLTRNITDECETEVTVSYLLEIVDSYGKILKSREIIDISFSHNYHFGFGRFMKKKELIESMENSVKDSVVFRCYVFHKTFKQNIMLYEAQTEFLAQKFLFQSKILFSDSQEWSKTVHTPCRSPFQITLTIPGDRILVKIQKTSRIDSSLFYKVKLVVLSNKNVKIKLENFEHKFEPNKCLEFETSFEKSLVQYDNNYHSIYSFTLKCIIFSFKGRPKTTVESYSFCSDYPQNVTFHSRRIPVPTIKSDRLSIQDDLKGMLLNEKHSDVKLRAGGHIFAAHKFILIARSPVFSAMFDQDMLETQTGVVDITDVESEILRCFLEYLYTDIIEFTDYERVLKLLLVADKYQIAVLKEQCSRILIPKICSENVLKAIAVPDIVNQNDLKLSCVEFINSNRNMMLSSSEWSEWVQMNTKLAIDIFSALLTD